MEEGEKGGGEEFWGFEKHCVLKFFENLGLKKIGSREVGKSRGEEGGVPHSRRRRLEKNINVYLVHEPERAHDLKKHY